MILYSICLAYAYNESVVHKGYYCLFNLNRQLDPKRPDVSVSPKCLDSDGRYMIEMADIDIASSFDFEMAHKRDLINEFFTKSQAENIYRHK